MEEALEMARCALINLENMVTIMPVLKLHPLLPVVQMQITETIRLLEVTQHDPVDLQKPSEPG